MAQTSSTQPSIIKVAPDFIDLVGVGRNMYVAGSRIMNYIHVENIVKDITIDFSGNNVIFGRDGGFSGHNNILSPTFKLQNMVVENQNFGTDAIQLFSGMIDCTNCRFENLVQNATYPYFEYNITSTTTNCIFRNIVNNHSANRVFYYVNGTHTIDNCIFDNTVRVVGNTGSVINYSRCYISVSDTFVLGGATFNFSQCYIRNRGISTEVGLVDASNGDVTNCTFVNMRIAVNTGGVNRPSNIRHCTQIYTLPIGAMTILNPLYISLAHTIENNIFISPNSNNIFSPTLTSLTEGNNLYLCANPNPLFTNSTHYPASTPITTLIDMNEQGIGSTFKRYYLPTMTNNVEMLTGMEQNQIEQNRTNPTNIGAI